jgi:glycosyltransferase involved in cell wall biosynthesis
MTMTIADRVRKGAGVCHALLTARGQTRRRKRASRTPGVLYLLETGGPGGAERMLLDLAQHVGPDWQPVVGVMKSGWLRANATAAGIPCVMLQGDGLGDVGVLGSLVEAIAAHDVAVIHAHEFYMALVGAAGSLATGVPLVVTVHGKHYYPDRRRRQAIYRLIARQAATLVTVSQDLRRFFCQTTRTPLDRVGVIYNGIALRSPAERSRNLGLLDAARIPRSARIVGAVGNLYPVKGHLDLIRAARTIVARRPETHLIILGRGAEHDTLLAEASALGIADRVHLLGYREDVAQWLTVMDVFAMPSRSEGLPLSLLEAMGTGLPAVVTGVGGMVEVVRDGETGFVVPTGDVEELADRIAFLLGDPARTATMGAAARDLIVARFGLNRMMAEYRRVYGQAARRPARLQEDLVTRES